MKKLFLPVLLLSVTTWVGAQTAGQSTPNHQKEEAQEKASGINDAVDIVNGPTFQQTGPNSGTLTWQTNNVAATNVNYGTNSSNPGQKAYTPGGSRDHTVQLTNLQPNTTYYYEIETRTGKDRFKGQFQTGAAGSTTAAAAPAPGTSASGGTTNAWEAASGINDNVDVTGDVTFNQTGADSGTLNWTTNKTAATRVRYGTDANNLSQQAAVPGGSTSHSAQLTGLKPGTLYYYSIDDQSGRSRYKSQFMTK